MGFMLRIIIGMAALVAIGFALWLSLTLFAVLALFGIGAWLAYMLRDFLLGAGILNPHPGEPMPEVETREEEKITVIEGEYKKIDEK